MKAYRLAKRSPWLTVALMAFFLALTSGVSGIAWWAKIANDRADEIARKSAWLRVNLYASDISTASLAVRRGDTPLAAEILSRWDDTATEEDPRGFEWHLLKAESHPVAHRLLDQRAATVTQLAFSPDGKHLAVADQDHHWQIKSVMDAGEIKSSKTPGDDIAVIPATLGGGWVVGTKDMLRWLDTDMEEFFSTPGAQFSLAATSPRVIIGEAPRFHWWVAGGSARVMDWENGEILREIPGDWRHVVISPDGKTAALAGAASGLRLLNIDTGAAHELPISSPVWALSFSSDGTRLAAGTRDSALIWDLTNKAPPLILPHPLTVWMTAFSADDRYFLTASSDRRVRVWDSTHLSDPLMTLTGHRSEVWCAAFSPDGKSVAAGGKDGSVLVWDIMQPDSQREPLAHTLRSPPFFTPDGNRVIHHQDDRSQLFQLRTEERQLLPENAVALGVSMDGEWIHLIHPQGKIGRTPLSNPDRVEWKTGDFPSCDIRTARSVAGGRWVARVYS